MVRPVRRPGPRIPVVPLEARDGTKLLGNLPLLRAATCMALIAIAAPAPTAIAQSLPVTASHSEAFPGSGRLQPIGDVDDDGFQDFHVLLNRLGTGLQEETLSVIYSGATGGALRTYANWQSTSTTTPFLVPFALGDIDGDGDEEFAELSVVETPLPPNDSIFTTRHRDLRQRRHPPVSP
ncbi:MAG: hypothetical protein R3F20_06525 [Planctomycetota bacterium]